MSNPATELHALLTTWRHAPGNTNHNRRNMSSDEGIQDHARAMGLLADVGREIDKLEDAGRRVAAYRALHSELIQGVLALQSSWTANSPATRDFSDRSLAMLEALADTIDHAVPTTPLHPRAIEALSTLLAEVLVASEADDSIDAALAVYIRSAVRHLQTCIDEYETVGESATMLAYQGVWVATRAAAAVSDDPSKWTKFKERMFFPTAAGLLGNAPSLMMQIAGGA